MKRILLPAALLVAFAGTAAFAQTTAPLQSDGTQAAAPAPPPHQHHAKDPHKEAMKMGQELGLSQDQVAKVEPILADRQTKVAALDPSLTPEEHKKQAHKIEKDSDSQLAGVLTPDQMQQMKSMHHGGHHGGPGGPGAPPPPAPPAA